MKAYTTIKTASLHWPNLTGPAYANAIQFARKYLKPLARLQSDSRDKLYPSLLLHAIYAVYSLKYGSPTTTDQHLTSILEELAANTTPPYTVQESDLDSCYHVLFTPANSATPYAVCSYHFQTDSDPYSIYTKEQALNAACSTAAHLNITPQTLNIKH